MLRRAKGPDNYRWEVLQRRSNVLLMGALADERRIYRPVISHSSSLRVSADFVLISFFLFFSIKLVGCGCCCPPGWNWTAPELTTPPLTHTHTLGWFESIDVWLVSRVSLLQSSSLMLSQCHLVLFLSLFFLPVILLFSLRHHSSAPVKKKNTLNEYWMTFSLTLAAD